MNGPQPLPPELPQIEQAGMSRRNFLRISALVAGYAVLEACSGDSTIGLPSDRTDPTEPTDPATSTTEAAATTTTESQAKKDAEAAAEREAEEARNKAEAQARLDKELAEEKQDQANQAAAQKAAEEEAAREAAEAAAQAEAARLAELAVTPEKPAVNQPMMGLSIPAIGLDATVFGWDGKGEDESPDAKPDAGILDSTTELNEAGQPTKVLGYNVLTDVPGTIDEYGGRTIIFGHRTHGTAPLGAIDKLKAGDTMTETFMKDGVEHTRTWKMSGDPQLLAVKDLELATAVGPGDKSELMMYACAEADGGTGHINPTTGKLEYHPTHRWLTTWELV